MAIFHGYIKLPEGHDEHICVLSFSLHLRRSAVKRFVPNEMELWCWVICIEEQGRIQFVMVSDRYSSLKHGILLQNHPKSSRSLLVFENYPLPWLPCVQESNPNYPVL